MNIYRELQAARAIYLRRRWFLRDCGLGLAGIAASALMKQDLSAEQTQGDEAANPLAARAPHFEPKAQRVIYMFHAGAPSQLELFDHKIELARHCPFKEDYKPKCYLSIFWQEKCLNEHSSVQLAGIPFPMQKTHAVFRIRSGSGFD